MRKNIPLEWTNGDLLDALGAFVMALATQMPPGQVDRISTDLLATAEGMKADGHDAAAMLSSALAGALYLPQRDRHPDPH